ncbi:MAG: N-acetylmuramoyl-L-alanine amidase, partial [Clostridia bacterium]
TCASVFGNESEVVDNIAYTIVIDAGHGGIDGGVTGVKTGVRESDLNLNIALILETKLKENGFTVVMTRKTKDGLYGSSGPGFKRRDMKARREIIENAHADLVISIHINSYVSPYRSGPQVFFQKNAEKGKQFAEIMQKSLNKNLHCNNLFLSGDFYICREVSVPSIIVECGYLSNISDEEKLLKKDYRENIANAIMEGCMGFLFVG